MEVWDVVGSDDIPIFWWCLFLFVAVFGLGIVNGLGVGWTGWGFIWGWGAGFRFLYDLM